MFAFYLGIYLLLGLPICVGMELVNDGVPISRRALNTLIYLPLWPMWTVLGFKHLWDASKAYFICGWCNDFRGTKQDIARHAFECKEHPIRKWLQAQGWDIVRDGDGFVLGEYFWSGEKGWRVDHKGDYVYITPINDKHPHDNYSETCACEPKVEDVDGTTIVTHNAYDFREVIEYLNDKDGE